MMSGLFMFVAGFAGGVFFCLMLILFRTKKQRSNQSSSTDFLSRGAGRKDLVSELKYNVKMWNILSNSLPIHVYIKNADDEFRYVYSNKSRNDFFKKRDDELIGQNDTVLLSPENAKKQLAIDADIMTKPQGDYEGLIEAQDCQGNQKHFRIVQTQFTDDTGTRLLLGAAVDITEQEVARRLLTESKKQIEERELWLSRTLASIDDAVVVTDRNGHTVLMNPVAERMLGVQLNDVIGKPHEEFFHIVDGLDDSPRPSPVAQALQTDAIIDLSNHTVLISPTGDRYHISSSASSIKDEQHHVFGAVLVFRDVTEINQRRAALRDAVNDWEMASMVSGIVSFRLDFKTRKISGSRRLSEFWPIENGIAARPEDWIMPEDLAQGNALMDALVTGQTTQTFYKYRVQKEGKIRYYRIFAAIDTERPGEITGIIQDFTEAFENELELHNVREMWNQFIDIIPMHFFTKSVNTPCRYTSCNRLFAKFVGKPMEEIIGKTDAELFAHTTDVAYFEKDDQRIISSGVAESITETVYDAQLRPFEFRTIKMLSTGPAGEEILLCVSVDITELVKLSRSHEVIRQSLEMLVLETDVNEGITKAMKSVCEHIDVSRCFLFHFDMTRQTVSCTRKYCRKGDEKFFPNIQDQPLSSQINWPEYFKSECFYNFPDIQNEEVLQKLGPFYAGLVKKDDLRSLYCHRLLIDGKFWGFVGFAYQKKARILDKSELEFIQSAARFIELMIFHKRTQEELHTAVVQAQAAEKAKSNFLATMSHEIRTPLNAVIGYSELLKDGTLPEDEQKDYLKDISIAGNALLALINDILDLSKLDAGKMKLAKSTTDFAALAHEMMIIFRQRLSEKQLTEHLELDDLPLLKLDQLRVRQILFNLLGNAVKFTDQGSITVSANFVPDQNGRTGTLSFAVQDTGCGISQDDAKQLFQPFVQSNALLGTRKAGNGTGLGLALVRRMLDLMDGSVSLESTPGVGSVFTVVMRNVEYSYEKMKFPLEQELTVPQLAPFTSRILIVDDIPMNLKVMTAMLQKLGLETVASGNATDALAELEKQPFDIVLTDLWMPGMNGDELAEKIRRSGKYPALKIAIVTADTELGINYNSEIFDAVLTKPVTTEKLRSTIGKLHHD